MTPNPGAARKFFPDGRARPFPGNTFISMVPDGAFADGCRRALSLLHSDPIGSAFAILPADSMHVTVLGGTLAEPAPDQYWPTDTPSDQPIEQVTDEFLQRLERARPTAPATMGFSVDAVADITDPNRQLTISLRADEDTAAALLSLRRQLIDLLRLPADAERYRPHVTLGYRVDTTGPATDDLERLRTELRGLLPDRLETDRVLFTDFEDMTAFRPRWQFPVG